MVGGLGIPLVSALALSGLAEVELRDRPRAPQPIIGGELTETGEFDGVVAVFREGGFLCTGTVVAPRIVLTAAHCLSGVTQPQHIRVYFGDRLDSTMSVGVVRFGVHPDFCPPPECKEDIHDYGYVEIAADFVVPGGFLRPIVDQSEWDQTIVKGGEVTLVGYGEDPDVGGLDKGIGIKRKVTTTIKRFSAKGLEFFAGGNNKDSCEGDSGGPAFVRLEDGTWRLAGITSRGSAPCGDGGYYGAPYPALCWLREETGVDLLGARCSDCDCLDLSPHTDDGCRIAPHEPPSPAWLFTLLLPFFPRPHRKRHIA